MKGDQLFRKHPRVICARGRRVAVVDADVAALRPPKPFERGPERREACLYFRILLSEGRKHANPPDSVGLLRARRERPRRRRAAEQRDELAALHCCSHSINSSAMASSLSGILRPSAFAVQRLMTNSNLVDCMTGRSAGLAPFRILPV